MAPFEYILITTVIAQINVKWKYFKNTSCTKLFLILRAIIKDDVFAISSHFSNRLSYIFTAKISNHIGIEAQNYLSMCFCILFHLF